jgi:hypothetical protein
MITIVYSTHKDKNYNENFKSHLKKTIGVKDFQILEYENFNQYSLAQVYNKGISESIYDIVVCCHNDIKLENGWGKKLINDFENNPDYGIIGKAGSCYFPESGIYWERMQQTMVGQVYHHPQGKSKWLSRYSAKLPFLIPVVTIDGLFISFNKNKINHVFDETIGKFHFYDHLFCLPNYLDGVKIGVTSSFEITHESVGQPNQEFFDSKVKFLEKFGKNLPLDLKPNFVYKEDIKKSEFKKIKKVAIIIPTKGKTHLLFNCVSSFIDNCDTKKFDFFIADTGSNEEEKDSIKKFISDNKDKTHINFIEYDYYNFAKINNDVVKNHINDEYEFILFCNNDIVVLNNVVDEMLSTFKDKANAGTVGCRLHFEDNTIQHDGVFMGIQQGRLLLSHVGFKSYYNYSTSIKTVIGNTAALMMVRKNVFIRCGMFNEEYVSCFEDVELNLKCIIIGLENYFSGKSVAYHFESQTRKDDPETQINQSKDYMRLVPFVNQNIEKIKSKINLI